VGNGKLSREDITMNDRIIRIFISYSWTSQEHIDKVVKFASRLMNDGVEVILDKWDLLPGQDKYVFMEQTVNASTVERVLLVCDKMYMQKANSRKGGVGEETMIISSEIYGQVSQDKFVPVIFESDENGDAYLPAYIKSRFYIDLSKDEIYETEYDKLLRHIYDKPLYSKPKLGTMPAYLGNSQVNLAGIQGELYRLQNDEGKSKNRTNEFISRFSDSFFDTIKEYKVLRNELGNGQIIVDTIIDLKSIRDIYIETLSVLLATEIDIVHFLTSFFERFFNDALKDETEYENEHLKFFLWECFLCSNALLFKRERFSELYDILNHTYFLDGLVYRDIQACTYGEFRFDFDIIEKRYKPESDTTDLFTLAGNILSKRDKLPQITAQDIITADIEAG